MDRRGSITTYVVIAVVLIFMIASCCILKQTNILRYGPRWWNRQNRKDDNNRPAKLVSFEVASVPTGNSIEVEAGRKGRTITITLGGIGVPTGYQADSWAHLKKLAGATIRAEVPGRRLQSEPDTEPPEARSDFTSPLVYGESGLCLQLEQLKAGMACTVERPNESLPADWLAAEKAAQKAGIGIWRRP